LHGIRTASEVENNSQSVFSNFIDIVPANNSLFRVLKKKPTFKQSIVDGTEKELAEPDSGRAAICLDQLA